MTFQHGEQNGGKTNERECTFSYCIGVSVELIYLTFTAQYTIRYYSPLWREEGGARIHKIEKTMRSMGKGVEKSDTKCSRHLWTVSCLKMCCIHSKTKYLCFVVLPFVVFWFGFVSSFFFSLSSKFYYEQLWRSIVLYVLPVYQSCYKLIIVYN